MPDFHPGWAACAARSSGGRRGGARLPCPADPAPGHRRGRDRRLPAREPAGIEWPGAERCQRGCGRGGALEPVAPPAAGCAAQQAGQRQGVGHGAVAVRHVVEALVIPGRASRGIGVGQRPGAAAGGGERGGAGQPQVAECQVERVDPGLGVGEPAGRLGDGHAGDEAVPHGVRGGSGGGVEAGECVGRIAERDQPGGGIGAAQPGIGRAAVVGMREVGPVGVGFVWEVVPGGAQPRIVVVHGVLGVRVGAGEPVSGDHGGVSLRY